MKKIDTKNSLIFDPKMVKATFGHLGEEGYFSNYKDFSIYIEGILGSVTVSNNGYYPYATEYDCQGFDYFITKNNVVFIEESKKNKKKKKYRPYLYLVDLPFKVGDVITYRCKQCCSVCDGIVTGIEYQNNDDFGLDNIIIGGINATPQELFDHYELLDDNCQYKPFGVEE